MGFEAVGGCKGAGGAGQSIGQERVGSVSDDKTQCFTLTKPQ